MPALDAKDQSRTQSTHTARPPGRWGTLLSLARRFWRDHVKAGEDGERSLAVERRYVIRAARFIIGCIYTALACRAQLAFSVYPFGIAFLCSVGRELPVYSAVSLIVSLSFGRLSNIYAAMSAIILLSRTLICIFTDMKEEGVRRFPRYNEYSAYRIILSCVVSFCIGIYNLFSSAFSYYSLLGSLLIMAVCPVSAYIFISASDRTEKKEIRDTGRLFEAAVLIWALSDIVILSVRAATVAAFCLIAYESGRRKKGGAALMGLAIGIPFGISSCAIYALCGVVCAVMGSLSRFLGVLCSFTFLVMAEGYVGGYSALLECLPGASVGLVLTLLWQKFNISERISCFSLSTLERAPTPEREDMGESAKRIADISHAFASMSGLMRSLSVPHERLCVINTSEICEQSCDAVCTSCKNRCRCWDADGSSTADAFSKVASALSHTSRLTETDLPELLRARCISKAALLAQLNSRTHEAVCTKMKKSGCGLLASDYESIAKILDSHLCRTYEEQTPDTQTAQALMELCRARLYGIGSITVRGTRRKVIYASGISLSSHTVSASELKREFERICKTPLSSPVYSINESDIEFEMHTTPALTLKCAQASLPKTGERVSGDCSRTLTNDDGYCYGILCDGMGSGPEAAYTSRVCVEYLSSMLESANPKELTIEMLNAVLREREGECSSTVDLFELDTYTGEGCFIKSGAAPSYVCRDKNVYKVASKTIPIGITERIGAEKIKFRLRAGDIVVMVSDGIVEGPDEGRLVVEALCRRTTEDPFDIAAYVLSRAKSINNSRDDMTVIVMTCQGE